MQKADVYKRTTEITEVTYSELNALDNNNPFRMADNIFKYVEQQIERVYERKFCEQFISKYIYNDNGLFWRMLEMLSMIGIFNEAKLGKHPNRRAYLKLLDSAIKVLENAEVSDTGICVGSQEEASKAAIELACEKDYMNMWKEILLMVNEYTRYSGRKDLCGKDIELYKNTFLVLWRYLHN